MNLSIRLLALSLVSSLPVFAAEPDAECLNRVDSQHACACNDVRGKAAQDPGAFDPQRPDVAKAIELVSQGHPDLKSRVQKRLAERYDEQRELLGCKDKLQVMIGGFILAEHYCVHEPEAAQRTGKPLCSEAGVSERDQARLALLEQEKKFFGTSEKSIERLSVCHSSGIHPKTYMRAVAVQAPPCKVDLKSLFPDNQWQLSPAQTQKILASLKNHECVQQAKESQLPLQRIEITSSSSRLANTGSAAHLTFSQLSEGRAEEIEQKIIQAAFDAQVLAQAQITQDTRGDNGDGTSGACPYAYNRSQRTWIRKSFPTATQLEENKRTELRLYYGAKSSVVANGHHSDLMALPCQRVQFVCR